MCVARSAVLLSFVACAVFAIEVPTGVAEHYGLADSDILEVVDVTGNGEVTKLVIRRGNEDVPAKGQTVNAHYDGKLANGKPFDSSRKRGQPFSFQLGQGRVIKGWDVGFATMSVGMYVNWVAFTKYH
jgi:FKBP-type peptidyl-prolyl cis-trans isomerase